MTEALQKFKYFVLGCPELIVATDHKPLLGVVNGSLSNIDNPRLLAIIEKTLWFKYYMCLGRTIKRQILCQEETGRPSVDLFRSGVLGCRVTNNREHHSSTKL